MTCVSDQLNVSHEASKPKTFLVSNGMTRVTSAVEDSLYSGAVTVPYDFSPRFRRAVPASSGGRDIFFSTFKVTAPIAVSDVLEGLPEGYLFLEGKVYDLLNTLLLDGKSYFNCTGDSHVFFAQQNSNCRSHNDEIVTASVVWNAKIQKFEISWKVVSSKSEYFFQPRSVIFSAV